MNFDYLSLPACSGVMYPLMASWDSGNFFFRLLKTRGSRSKKVSAGFSVNLSSIA